MPTKARRSLRVPRLLLLALTLVGFLHTGLAERADPVARVGFVGPGSPSTAPGGTTEFWHRLRELGWIEGENLVIEARWGGGSAERLPALVAEVIERDVDVLVTYGTPATIAAKNATSTIPIVAAAMGEPLRTGLATNLPRPGGNLTGLSLAWGEGVQTKWLELLQECIPRLTTVAVMLNPDNLVEQEMVKDLEAVAATHGLKLGIIAVREPGSLDIGLEQARQQNQALLVFADAMLLAHKERITAFAAKRRLPAVYVMRDFAYAGGLMSYGPGLAVQFRRAADYVDKILKGAKPGDLPIEQPTQFELIVNLKTAKALGLNIPQAVLLRADTLIR